MAYNPENSRGAGMKAKALIKDDEIKDGLVERAKAEGLTEKRLHNRLSKQLDATKDVYYDPRLVKATVPDNAARIEAIKTGYKVLGLLKEGNVVDNRQVTFTGNIDALVKVMNETAERRAKLATDTIGEVV